VNDIGVSPTQVIANWTVPPAQPLKLRTRYLAFQVMSQPFDSRFSGQPGAASIACRINATPDHLSGTFASIFPANGTQFPAGMQLTLNGADAIHTLPTQINFAIPAGFPGPHTDAASGGNAVSIV